MTPQAMKWRSVPVEIEAMTYAAGYDTALAARAAELVDWVNENDGVAELEPGMAPRVLVAQGMGSGMVEVQPGYFVVLRDWLCTCGEFHKATCDEPRAVEVVGDLRSLRVEHVWQMVLS